MFKQLILAGALLFCLSFTGTIYAQDYILEDNVPILVRNSFYDNYSGTYDIDKGVRWMNEYRDSYTAEYSKDGMVYRITYDENGSIARTESQIEASTLPYLVRDNFLSAYPNVKIYYSGIIDDSQNGTLYRVGYSEADASPGTPGSFIYYKGDGTIYIWK
jgi:hypothetical protein